MILEIDQVVVKKELWQKALKKDVEAINNLRQELHGLVLYFHNIIVEPDSQVVSIRELEDIGVIAYVEICSKLESRATP